MLYNVVFGCHGNTCYVSFVGAIFYASGSKVMAQIVVFVFSVTLTLTFDLCSIFFCHTHCA